MRTGEVWPQFAIEYAEEAGEIDADDDDPDRWLWVECEGSHDGYRDMEWFIDDLDDPQLAYRLARAISGRRLPSVQGHAVRSARADDAVVRVLQRPPTRASPQLVGGRGLRADQAARAI